MQRGRDGACDLVEGDTAAGLSPESERYERGAHDGDVDDSAACREPTRCITDEVSLACQHLDVELRRIPVALVQELQRDRPIILDGDLADLTRVHPRSGVP